MTLHTWNGPQERLGNAGVVAHTMTVLRLDGNRASGVFTFIDYVEGGIEGSDTWDADRTLDQEGNAWTVCCTSETFWQSASGEKYFTLDESINRAIRRFVSQKLELIRAEGKLPDQVRAGAVQMDLYTGPCVCEALATQNMGGSISWSSLAEGRSCAPRVHLCRCGRKWWNCDEEGANAWIEVGDDVAWNDILTHNGACSVYMGVLDGKLFTAQTLRDRGLVPFG